MGRSFKNGIESFLFSTTTDNDTKFQIIEAKYGITGFGVIVKLYQMIYGDIGYYCRWDDLIATISASKWSSNLLSVTENNVEMIVNDAAKYGIFDNELLQNHGILTSRGIQKRYFEVARRRTRIDVEKDYLLLSVSELPDNVYINGINVNKNPENADKNPTKEGKGRERNTLSKRESIKKFPTLKEVTDFCRKENLKINPEKFFYYYSAKKWKGITDFKAKAREWSVTENKKQESEIGYAAYDIAAFERSLNEEV